MKELIGLPDRLKKLREKRGLTQEELGKMIKATDATINRYEKGLRKPDPETIVLLSEIFEVTTDYLLGRTDTSQQVEVIAAHRTDNSEEGLSQEALDEIEFLKQYVIDKYRNKKADKP